jgi:hypothetical protein
MTKLFNNEQNAKLRLFNFTCYDKVIHGFKKMLLEHNFDILIGGSSLLSAVMIEPNKQFKPNDMDIYIKNITNEKIITVDEHIHKIFNPDDGFNIYIVRRSITMTWWVFKNDVFCIEIQLNLYGINSWSEVFALYHADMVCIGYDIKYDDIITYESRWLTFAESYSHNSLIFMTDEYGLRNKKHISNIVSKYASRNFNIVGISNSVDDDDDNDMSGSANTILNDDMTTKKPIDILILKYAAHDDIFIDSNIKNLLTKIETPKLLQMSKPNNSQFMDSVFDIDLCDSDNVECPVYLCNVNLIMQNTACDHFVSMNAYIKQKINKCPLCRTLWEEKNTYISCAKTHKIQMIDRENNIKNNKERHIVIDNEQIQDRHVPNNISPLPEVLDVGIWVESESEDEAPNTGTNEVIDTVGWYGNVGWSDDAPVVEWDEPRVDVLDNINWIAEEINEQLSGNSDDYSSSDDSDDESNVNIRHDNDSDESDSD